MLRRVSKSAPWRMVRRLTNSSAPVLLCRTTRRTIAPAVSVRIMRRGSGGSQSLLLLCEAGPDTGCTGAELTDWLFHTVPINRMCGCSPQPTSIHARATRLERVLASASASSQRLVRPRCPPKSGATALMGGAHSVFLPHLVSPVSFLARTGQGPFFFPLPVQRGPPLNTSHRQFSSLASILHGARVSIDIHPLGGVLC